MYDHDLDLDDLLSDPLVRLVMASDGVEEAHIRKLAQRIAPRASAGKSRADDRWACDAASLRPAASCWAAWRGGSPTQPSA